MTEAVGTIVIDNEKCDDWMKTLPGYQDEVEISERAHKKKAAVKVSASKVVRRKQ